MQDSSLSWIVIISNTHTNEIPNTSKFANHNFCKIWNDLREFFSVKKPARTLISRSETEKELDLVQPVIMEGITEKRKGLIIF